MEKDIENIFKKIMAKEAGIRTFDDLAESFDSTYLKGLSKADATKFATWFLENGYDKEGEARAWLNENTDRLLSQSAIDDDTSFAMEQSGMDEVAETNRQFEQELLDDMDDAQRADRANADSLDNYPNRAEDFVPESPASTDRINQSILESQGASDSQISNASTRPTTRAMKFLKALDYLDPVEKVATGLLTALNLPNLAKGYITYEVANLVGNLLMGGFKSAGDVQLMNSLILTGGNPEEIKAAKERIEKTGTETMARVDKFSITSNIYEQIGKMLNR
tara:strand:- start:116 stop:952 length:837 start_codon:yes stop_codon:yes gene_type:complete